MLIPSVQRALDLDFSPFPSVVVSRLKALLSLSVRESRCSPRFLWYCLLKFKFILLCFLLVSMNSNVAQKYIATIIVLKYLAHLLDSHKFSKFNVILFQNNCVCVRHLNGFIWQSLVPWSYSICFLFKIILYSITNIFRTLSLVRQDNPLTWFSYAFIHTYAGNLCSGLTPAFQTLSFLESRSWVDSSSGATPDMPTGYLKPNP